LIGAMAGSEAPRDGRRIKESGRGR